MLISVKLRVEFPSLLQNTVIEISENITLIIVIFESSKNL